MSKCLNPMCQNQDHYGRGLCRQCYILAYRLIKDGVTSWQILESKGKALPPKDRRSPNRKWFEGVDKAS